MKKLKILGKVTDLIENSSFTMFSFYSNGQFCIAIQGRALFKNKFLFSCDKFSNKCA